MQEHRVIEQVLDCLDIMAQRAKTTNELDVESAIQAIDFLTNFADRCHHGKEEGCLFPLLEEKGFSRAQGPTGVMICEHEEGRRLIHNIAISASAVAAGSVESIGKFAAHAKAYSQLLREHIHKEDHCLFRMADKVLNEQDQLRLLKSFAEVEHDDLEPETHEKYLKVAFKLRKRYGVPCQTMASSIGDDCCGQL
jgi:hemerythrin-like domain-containing protein